MAPTYRPRPLPPAVFLLWLSIGFFARARVHVCVWGGGEGGVVVSVLILLISALLWYAPSAVEFLQVRSIINDLYCYYYYHYYYYYYYYFTLRPTAGGFTSVLVQLRH